MKITFTCKKCGSEFQRPASYVKKSATGIRYCSRKCYLVDAKFTSNRGEKCYNFIKEVPPFLIEDEITAYFLGFLQTDGTLAHKYATIAISEIDKDILYYFQSKFGGKISFRTKDTNFKKNYHLAQWRIGSVAFVKQMNNLGIPCGKKSLIVKPIDVPKDLERHYIRGLIDGDGSLLISSKNHPMIGFTTASDAMANYYVNWLLQIGIKTTTRRNKRDNIFNISFINEKAQKVASILYENATIALPRKLLKAKEIINWKRTEECPKNDFSNDRWTEKEIYILKQYNFDYRIIDRVKLPGRTNDSIILKCRKLKKLQA